MKPTLPLSIFAFISPKNNVKLNNHNYQHQRLSTMDTTTSTRLNMEEIAAGVEFDTIAREWRCKWSPDGDKASLVACQMALESVVEDINEVEGIKSIERVVCGGCLDFKVITSVSAEDFSKWEKEKFDPEEYFIEMLQVIDGVSQIETQTYTKMPVIATDFIDD